MFLENSRYKKTSTTTTTVRTTSRESREVEALKLRRLPPTAGEPHEVIDHDQLDVMAHGAFGDGTKFWHIADANSELEAGRLLDDAGATIEVPKS